MKLSLLIDSSKIDIDDFYKEITELLKNINYELIFIDNGINEEKLKDLYNKDLLHTRVIYYSGNISEILDKSIKYCSGNYIGFYNNKYDLDLLNKMIDYLDEHKECDYYKYVFDGNRSFIDKLKHYYPTDSFLVARNNIVSYRCLIGYNGIEEKLDEIVTIDNYRKQESFIGNTIGFNNDNLL